MMLRISTLACVVTLAAGAAACGTDSPGASATRPAPVSDAAAARFELVGTPVVQFDGQWFRAIVRTNRTLPGGDGPKAMIDVSGAEQDMPGLQREEGVRRCYYQDDFLVDERRPPDEGQPVGVKLTILGRHRQVLRAEAPVERVKLIGDNAEAVRRLGCPPAPPEDRCDGGVVGRHMEIWLRAAGGGATCATARRVMRAVGRWADSARCFQNLCVRRHRMNAGYRCTVAKIGEADWTITCRRGRRFVRGFAAD